MNLFEYENYHENKVHSDPSFPYNTYLCSIPLDFTNVPLHWHDELEIIYIKKGKGLVYVDFREYLVESNTIILILPGQLHSISRLDLERMEYENILFDPGMLISKKKDHSSQQFLLPLFEGTLPVPTIYTPIDPGYLELIAPIDACDRINAEKPLGYELFIKSQLYLFFYVLQGKFRQNEGERAAGKSYEKLKSVLKYLENHYMEEISIREIAGIAGFSESHFMRYFKETMGMTFISYLKDYRLTIAARLLIASSSSILEIAGESGFENISYFNRAFKQKYGMTPSKYRHKSGVAAV